MSVYEVHLGSWRQGLSYVDLAEHLVNYVKDLGFTHVELLPVMEHPFVPSWGYHVTNYYAPTSRFGTPDDFRYLVDRLHQNGIGVILDWVPGHFATDEWALARFDGRPLYEHPDPRKGWHPEWGSFIFDLGRPEVRNFLVANALYWFEEFHADGIRVDGVASMLYLDFSRQPGEWIPNSYGGRENLEAVQLLQEVNGTAYREYPGIVSVAEESTSWSGVTASTDKGGLGFGFKWNMGWMNDALRYLGQDPIFRQYHHSSMTFALMYAFSENFVLPISHDEVVHGKGSLLRKSRGTRDEQLATLRAFLAYMWAHPGKQLIFMGCEFGQESEWAEGRSLDWWLLDQPAHYRVHAQVKDMNRIYRDHREMWEHDSDPAGFRWLNADDAGHNTFAFLCATGRVTVPPTPGRGRRDQLQRHDARALPRRGPPAGWVAGRPRHRRVPARLAELGRGRRPRRSQSWDNQPYAIGVTVPALSTVWLVPKERDRREPPARRAAGAARGPHRRHRPRRRVLRPDTRRDEPRPDGRVRDVGAPRVEPEDRVQRGAHPRRRRRSASTARPSASTAPPHGTGHARAVRAGVGRRSRSGRQRRHGPRGLARRVHPDSGRVARDPHPQPRQGRYRIGRRARRRDRRHAVAQPTRRRRFKYNPTHGGRPTPTRRRSSRRGPTS